MMSDLVQNLRAMSRLEHDDLSLGDEAADEIERLRALADSEGTRAVEYLRRARKTEAAIKQTWQMVDPLNPPGVPGSYARGHYQGMVDALNTLRANLSLTPNARLTGPKRPTQEYANGTE